MRLFNFFKTKKKNDDIIKSEDKIVSEKINYNGLIDVSKILTEDDKSSLETIDLLLNNPLKFSKKFNDWLLEYDFSPQTEPDIITAYILTGYNVDSKHDFGAYIDWKEENSEIIWSLKASIINKKYELRLDDIIFSNDECGLDALKVIGNYLCDTQYALVDWDIDGDCHNLFIVPRNKLSNLNDLGKNMAIKFILI